MEEEEEEGDEQEQLSGKRSGGITAPLGVLTLPEYDRVKNGSVESPRSDWLPCIQLAGEVCIK